MNLLADPIEGKVIPSNFRTIKHLTGSKLRDDCDVVMNPVNQMYFTESIQFPERDIIFITEKLDGSNVGVYKNNNKLYPITKKGYDVRTFHDKLGRSPWFLEAWASYVQLHQAQFFTLLKNGERIICEWMIHQQSLHYKLPHEPFVALAISNAENKLISYREFKERVSDFCFPTPKLLYVGDAITPLSIIEKIGTGFHGCESLAEGIVYYYERDGKSYQMAKYVSNIIKPTDRSIDDVTLNEYDGQFVPKITTSTLYGEFGKE